MPTSSVRARRPQQRNEVRHVQEGDLLSEDEEAPSREPTDNETPQDGNMQPTDDNSLYLRSYCKPLLKIGQSHLSGLDIIIIIILLLTVVVFWDFINRQINVPANTPGELLSSVEYRVQRLLKFQTQLDKFEKSTDRLKKQLGYLESNINDAERRMAAVNSEVEKIKTVDLPEITVQITSRTEDIKEILPLKAELKTALQRCEEVHGLQEIVNGFKSKWEGFEVEVKASISSSKETKQLVEVSMKKVEESLKDISDFKGEVETTLSSTKESIEKKLKTVENNVKEIKDNGSQIDEDDPLMQKVLQLEIDVRDIRAKTEKNASSVADILSLKKDMDDIRSVLRRKSSSQETNMEKLVTSFAENFETRDGVDQRMVEFNDSLNIFWGQKLVELEKRINSTINETTESVFVKTEKSVESAVNNLTTVINNRTTELNKSLENAKMEIQNNLTRFNETITELGEHTDAEIKSVNTTVDVLEKKFHDNAENVDKKLKTQNDAHLLGISNVRSEIKDVNGEIQKTEKQLQEGITHIKESQNTIKGQVNITRETSLSIETSSLLFFVNGVLIAVLFILVLTKKDTSKLEYSRLPEEPSSVLPKHRPSVSILDKIQRGQLLDQICVVSFHTETQTLHKRLANSAFQAGKVDVKTAFVEKHERIQDLPPSKIFFIFVDFNERNIILEDPNRELGDLKRTTVQAAKKIGGDVFVIYVRDAGSKVLPDGQLFNTKLTSIYQHAELSSLNRRNRVLSTFEEFTSYQKEHLSKSILQTLKVKT